MTTILHTILGTLTTMMLLLMQPVAVTAQTRTAAPKAKATSAKTTTAKSSPEAERLLKRSADKLRSSECLHVAYTATVDGHSRQGSLTMQGQMFTISADGMISWFDGKTQWTYSRQIGEVNVVTPTPDELQQINPLSLIRSFSTAYTATSLSADRVLLTPRSAKGDIRKAEITFDMSTLYPRSVSLTMSNRQIVTVKIDRVTASKALPAKNFRFDPAAFPNVQVVDLR